MTPAPPQYPSLLGATTPWRENQSSLVLRYRDRDGSLYYNCDVQMDIGAQTAGTFSGGLRMQGVGPTTDKACTWTAGFTAQMTRDGTVTDVHLSAPFFGGGCTAAGAASVSGTVTSATIRFDLTDPAMCQPPDVVGPVREFERTLTVSVRRLQ